MVETGAPDGYKRTSAVDSMTSASLPQELARINLERFQAEQRKVQNIASLAEKASKRLRDFVPVAWSTVEPATAFVPGWHIDAICEYLEAVTNGQIQDLIINMPPRHMKSLLVSVFWPAWEWTRKPSTRWLYSSYAESLSLLHSLSCRRVIEAPWYRQAFGSMFTLRSDLNTQKKFENNRSGYRMATSVSGSTTGHGADRLVADDPHNVQEAESDVIRQSVIDWWGGVMTTRRNDPKTSSRVIVMQRVHDADLTGHLLRQGGYEHLCLSAEYEP